MENATLLAEIAKKIEACQRCSLYQGARHSVPGEGNPEAKVIFIGEAPGFYEDQEGRPFVGAAGKLLTQSLESIGLSREDVFIANVLKHRPPENRDPLPTEINSCRVWLDQQLEVLRPRLVVTLGRFSLGRFVAGAKISSVHGKLIKAGRHFVLPMFHPAAALRSPELLEDFKKDFEVNQALLCNPESIESKESGESENDSQLDLFS